MTAGAPSPRALVAALRDPAYLVAADGVTILACNPAFARDVGAADAETCVGQQLGDLFTSDAGERFVAENRAVLAGEAPFENRERVLIAGQERHQEVRKTPLADESGTICALLCVLRDVTMEAAQEQERALKYRNASALYGRMFDSAMIGLFVTDLDGNIVDANPYALHLLGYTMEDLRSGAMRWQDLTPAEYAERDAQAEQELLAHGRCALYEKEYRHRDGSRIPIAVSAATLGNPPQGVVTFLLDLSLQKAAESATRAMRDRYRTLFEAMPMGVSIASVDGEIREVNRESEILLGLHTDEHQARRIDTGQWDILRADGTVMPLAEYPAARVRADVRRTEAVEMGVRRPDGGISWLECTAALIPLEPPEIAIAYVNVTARKLAEDALQGALSALDRAQALTGVGSIEVELTSGAVRASEQFTRMFGAPGTRSTQALRHVLRSAAPGDRKSLRDAIQRLLRGTTGSTTSERTTLHQVAPDTTRWIQWQALLVEGAAESGRRLVVTALDITDRRRLEERVLQAQKLESVGRLAGGVAHEFNNLLTAILGYVELLESNIPTDSPLQGDGAEIRHAARRAAELTAQLLAVARRQMVTARDMSMDALVRELERLLVGLAGAGVSVEFALAPNVSLVRADGAQLQQVLVNLIVNARDAMPNGGRLRVSVDTLTLSRHDLSAFVQHGSDTALPEPEAVQPGQYVVLEVQDAGVGMPPETIARLFEPFFTTMAPGRGTGLGLATVFGIVRQAGGFVRATSQEGVGTTMLIALPAVDAKPPVEPTAALPSRGLVLLADGDAEEHHRVHNALAEWRYDVLSAADGESALRLMPGRERTLAALVCTERLAGVPANEVAAAVRRHHPDATIVLLAAALEPDTGATEVFPDLHMRRICVTSDNEAWRQSLHDALTHVPAAHG